MNPKLRAKSYNPIMDLELDLDPELTPQIQVKRYNTNIVPELDLDLTPHMS